MNRIFTLINNHVKHEIYPYLINTLFLDNINLPCPLNKYFLFLGPSNKTIVVVFFFFT